MGRSRIENERGRFFTGTEGQKIDDLLHGFNDLFEKLADEINSHLSINTLVLDVACGEGKIWDLYPKAKVVGLDLSFENLMVAKKDVMPVQGDALKLPFASGTFDLVVISEILEHLFDPAKAIKEVSRVLKPGGGCIVTYPNTAALQFRMSLLFFGRNPALNYPDNLNHIRFFSHQDMQELVQGAGFRIEKVRGGSFLSFHQVNFRFYIPVPRKIRYLGGDWFPGLAWSNLLVLKKES